MSKSPYDNLVFPSDGERWNHKPDDEHFQNMVKTKKKKVDVPPTQPQSQPSTGHTTGHSRCAIIKLQPKKAEVIALAKRVRYVLEQTLRKPGALSADDVESLLDGEGTLSDMLNLVATKQEWHETAACLSNTDAIEETHVCELSLKELREIDASGIADRKTVDFVLLCGHSSLYLPGTKTAEIVKLAGRALKCSFVGVLGCYSAVPRAGDLRALPLSTQQPIVAAFNRVATIDMLLDSGIVQAVGLAIPLISPVVNLPPTSGDPTERIGCFERKKRLIKIALARVQCIMRQKHGENFCSLGHSWMCLNDHCWIPLDGHMQSRLLDVAMKCRDLAEQIQRIAIFQARSTAPFQVNAKPIDLMKKLEDFTDAAVEEVQAVTNPLSKKLSESFATALKDNKFKVPWQRKREVFAGQWDSVNASDFATTIAGGYLGFSHVRRVLRRLLSDMATCTDKSTFQRCAGVLVSISNNAYVDNGSIVFQDGKNEVFFKWEVNKVTVKTLDSNKNKSNVLKVPDPCDLVKKWKPTLCAMDAKWFEETDEDGSSSIGTTGVVRRLAIGVAVGVAVGYFLGSRKWMQKY